MKVINVYEQYFEAECVYNEIPRRAALVALVSTSEAGNIKYEVAVNFFPFRDPEDFAITYDAYSSKEIYNQAGRRSKKREEKLLEDFTKHGDELAESMNGKVFWDKPLRPAKRG